MKPVLASVSLLITTFALWASPVSADSIIDPAALDPSVKPCDDFYQYACGGWLATAQIASDRSTNERAWTNLIEQNQSILRGILENYSAGKMDPPSPYARQLGDFYSSCMDMDQIEKTSSGYLKGLLSQIDAIKDKSALPSALAQMHLEGVGGLFALSPNADLKNPAIFMAEIDQGGFQLPSSDFYKQDGFAGIRAKYRNHIAAMLALVGLGSKESAPELSAKIVSLESSLASHALSPSQLQDPTLTYHPTATADVQKLTPHFDWSAYYSALGATIPSWMNITESEFLKNMDAVIAGTDLGTLKLYLKWQLLETVAPSLSQDIYKEWFSFQGVVINGKKEPSPRWKLCASQVSGSMDDALGQAYVAKTFSSEAKTRAREMIKYIRMAMAKNLQSLEWLDEKTRQAALDKLRLVVEKIGYPDHWKSWTDLVIDPKQYAANVLAAYRLTNGRNFRRIGGAVDPSEWFMSPQTVNAYYDWNTNSINFPAAILQPPFFSPDATDAENYGGIGMVIGHELTHGFDPTGSKFDGHGVNVDWWTPATRQHFDESMACLINQYDKYEVLPASNGQPALYINGDLTKTENTADQGGSKLGFMAYQLATEGKTGPSVAGLTPDQQYFVSNAQGWCGKATDDYLREKTTDDPHSWDKFRIIGTVVNNPYFAQAFGCSVGSPMVPKDHCSVW